MNLSGDWVCSIHGTPVTASVQAGIGDRPIGLCLKCRGQKPSATDTSEEGKRRMADAERLKPIKSKLSPLVRPDEWHARAKRPDEAVPELSPWAEQVPETIAAKAASRREREHRG
jgi:hypothetical protein